MAQWGSYVHDLSVWAISARHRANPVSVLPEIFLVGSGIFLHFCKRGVSAVQGYPRSLRAVPIESTYATSILITWLNHTCFTFNASHNSLSDTPAGNAPFLNCSNSIMELFNLSCTVITISFHTYNICKVATCSNFVGPHILGHLSRIPTKGHTMSHISMYCEYWCSFSSPILPLD